MIVSLIEDIRTFLEFFVNIEYFVLFVNRWEIIYFMYFCYILDYFCINTSYINLYFMAEKFHVPLLKNFFNKTFVFTFALYYNNDTWKNIVLSLSKIY